MLATVEPAELALRGKPHYHARVTLSGEHREDCPSTLPPQAAVNRCHFGKGVISGSPMQVMEWRRMHPAR